MNLSFYIDECKNCILRHKILVIALLVLFLISTMCGIIIVKPTIVFDYYLSYCDNYIYKIFSTDSNVFSILTGRCLSNLLFLAVVCVSSGVIFLFPLQVFIVFYRGYVFGTELVILFTVYSVSGFFVALLLVVPQSIVFGLILVASSPFCCECGLQTYRSKSVSHMRGYLCWLLFFLALSFCAALLEFFTVIVIFKPFAMVL